MRTPPDAAASISPPWPTTSSAPAPNPPWRRVASSPCTSRRGRIRRPPRRPASAPTCLIIIRTPQTIHQHSCTGRGRDGLGRPRREAARHRVRRAEVTWRMRLVASPRGHNGTRKSRPRRLARGDGGGEDPRTRRKEMTAPAQRQQRHAPTGPGKEGSFAGDSQPGGTDRLCLRSRRQSRSTFRPQLKPARQRTHRRRSTPACLVRT